MLKQKKQQVTKSKLTKSEKLLDLSKDVTKKNSAKPISRKVRPQRGRGVRDGALGSLRARGQDFKEIKLIGRGNVGKVYLVRLRGTKGEGRARLLSLF